MPPQPHLKLIYIVPKTVFSPNLMIIIKGTFRNTSIPLKLYEINLFPTGSSDYESAESSLCWWCMNFKWAPRAQFSLYNLKFSDIILKTITIMN